MSKEELHPVYKNAVGKDGRKFHLGRDGEVYSNFGERVRFETYQIGLDGNNIPYKQHNIYTAGSDCRKVGYYREEKPDFTWEEKLSLRKELEEKEKQIKSWRSRL
jgi:hypothetical protein